MSNWEKVVKRTMESAATKFGKVWIEGPAISIGSATINFNPSFMAVFGFAPGHIINVFKDVAGKKIGFKKPLTEEDQTWAFKITGTKNKGKNPTCCVSAHAIVKFFPDAIGKAFAARLNGGESIIEVILE